MLGVNTSANLDNSFTSMNSHAGLISLISKYFENQLISLSKYDGVNGKYFIGGDTLLHMAVYKHNLEDVAILLSTGADVNAVGDYDMAPLHAAVLTKSPTSAL